MNRDFIKKSLKEFLPRAIFLFCITVTGTAIRFFVFLKAYSAIGAVITTGT